MKCPKCQCEQKDDNAQCIECGIYFEKYFKYHSLSEQPETNHNTSIRFTRKQTNSTDSILWHINQPVSQPALWGRCALLLGLIVWSYRLIVPDIASNAVGHSILHLVNLTFHEAGHILFRPFGEFITSFGGTLGQILMPFICFIVLLLKTRDPFGAAVALWWTGENFLDIAPYINDARAGILPLLGGGFGHSTPYGVHDWNYLLNESGFLSYDHKIARFSFFVGSLIMISAILWAGLWLLNCYRNPVSYDIEN